MRVSTKADYDKLADKKAEEKAEKDCQDKKPVDEESETEKAANQANAEDNMIKAADKVREEKKAAEVKSKAAVVKAEIKAVAEDKATVDKVLADKKAVVQGLPLIETPKAAEIKPLMSSDQAKKIIEEDKKEAADDKAREVADAAKTKSLSSVGEKKVTSDEPVPVAKCPSELKKEKADAD
jgi:hypothetical protein